MRDTIFDFLVTSRLPVGMIRPWWAKAISAVLFPLRFFYWRMSRTIGYQWETDTWLIDGVRYSGAMLRVFARAQGNVVRITRVGDVVTVEIVQRAP